MKGRGGHLLGVLLLVAAPAARGAERIGSDEAARLLVAWVGGAATYSLPARCLVAGPARLANGGYTIDLAAGECPGRKAGTPLGTWRVDSTTGELYVRGEGGRFGRPRGNGTALLREQREVTVAGARETWRLEWAAPPAPACAPDEVHGGWETCPCAGFEFGEAGDLVLVRVREGAPEEKLPLAPLFAPFETPGPNAVLRRWPVEAGDSRAGPGGALGKKVRARAPLGAMSFADYDRDGEATEFVLQVGAGPCFHRQSLVVGVDRRSRRLHAFGTADHPERPLVLEWPEQWEKLRGAKGEVSLVQVPCGDHGSDTETELVLRVDAKGIHGTRNVYECPEEKPGRGRLLSSEGI